MGVFRNPCCHYKSTKIFAYIFNIFLFSWAIFLQWGERWEQTPTFISALSLPWPNHCTFPGRRCFRIIVTEYSLQIIFKTTAIGTLEPKVTSQLKGLALWHLARRQLNLINNNFNPVIVHHWDQTKTMRKYVYC